MLTPSRVLSITTLAILVFSSHASAFTRSAPVVVRPAPVVVQPTVVVRPTVVVETRNTPESTPVSTGVAPEAPAPAQAENSTPQGSVVSEIPQQTVSPGSHAPSSPADAPNTVAVPVNAPTGSIATGDDVPAPRPWVPIPARPGCPRDSTQWICTGDFVVTNLNDEGRVLAINPSQHTVAVRLMSGLVRTYRPQDLALGMGCSGHLCVEDNVVTSLNDEGVVLGVNPLDKRVAIRLSSGLIRTYPISEIAIGRGCMGFACVDTPVISNLNDAGQVIAFSPNSGQAAVLLQSGLIRTYLLNSLAIGIPGCLGEVCFGDTVVTTLNDSGEVIGIDYAGRRAAVRLTSGLIRTYDVASLGITNYCDRYSSHEARVVPTAPVDQIRVRVIVDFDFRLTR